MMQSNEGMQGHYTNINMDSSDGEDGSMTSFILIESFILRCTPSRVRGRGLKPWITFD